MSISSSLNAGVAGLAANATRLATIADNISNSGTYGYKRVITDFEGMVINQARGAGLYSAGGVRASTARLIDQRGALVATSNPLDIAISGRGMLPVVPSVSMGSAFGDKPMMMTTTGSFRTDANGVLRTESGLVLLGWPANADGSIPVMPRDTMGGLEPVVINANQTAGDPTTRMNLGVNLPATWTDHGSEHEALPLKVEYFGNLGTSESLDITFEPEPDADELGLSNTWILRIRDSGTTDDAGTVADETLIGEYRIRFSNTQLNGGTLAEVEMLGGGAYDIETGTLALTVGRTGTYPGDLLTMTIGRPGDPNGLTQLGDNFAPTNITKDGSPVGNL
ncbi:MAG: flagellar hook-basal body complex protein, partial [Paracoccus sp. (in: a-proteobacteria)]|nr:flagellar hook-basal body complex protein [Paracoccus sp. (in: a-proteobacteria)]